ncbi:MAG: hypothetical protein JJT87_19315 [Halomonas sp.]|nr:hypothetical protein [Halomonas sp.]MCC5904066.1 hypothetical protein [Halomonas sp.]
MNLKDKAETAYRAKFQAWQSLPFDLREPGRSEIERHHSVWGRAIKHHFDREGSR